MGIYLNNTSAYSLYREDYLLTYFVDKTEILNELVPLLESKSKSSDASGKIRQKRDGEYDRRIFRQRHRQQ